MHRGQISADFLAQLLGGLSSGHATVWLALELISEITSCPSYLWSVLWTSLAPVHSPLAEALQQQTAQRLAGERDEIWEPLASARATSIPGIKYLTLRGSDSIVYRRDFMGHLGQMRRPTNFCKTALSITLESIGVALNCLVLIVSGRVVSQGPTRENLQTADSQAKKACSNVWLCSLFS